MSWDWKLDPITRDLTTSFITSNDEVIQRVITRLKRELGEWFLDTDAGLPWYQNGTGILGSRRYTEGFVKLLIRREVMKTEGVSRVLSVNTVFLGATRNYNIRIEAVLTDDSRVTIQFEGGA